MDGFDVPTDPTPDEAFAALKLLADVFLGGGARAPTDDLAKQEDRGPARSGTVLVDPAGAVQGVDAAAERLLGWNAAELVGRSAEAVLGRFPMPSATGDPVAVRVRTRSGSDLDVWATQAPMQLGAATCSAWHLQPRVAGADPRLELRYRHLVEQIPAVVFTAALDGGLTDIYVSPQIETLLGYSQAEWVASPVLWYERLHRDDRRLLDREFARGCASGGFFRAECRFWTRDGRIVWVHGEARLIMDERGLPVLLQGVAFDITETKRAEEVARASLREKETLLREIHHRVKNNLQVTSSLLRLQADRIENELARQALRDGQNRIRSMVLVHELLYRSKDLSRVDLGEYVRDLSRHLLRSYAVEPSQVRIAVDVQPVPVSIDVAVPCGLILNELVSNALKHAFPGGRPGTIVVEVRALDGGDELVVRDDGVGMPTGVDHHTGGTLGLQLVRTLAEQIEARLEVRTQGGTEVKLTIPQRRRPS